MKTLILLIAFPITVWSTLIEVPDDYETIQSALDSAAAGDTVFVYEGIYYENIYWPTLNGIKLIGENRDRTIIDGMANGKVIVMPRIIDGSDPIDTNTVLKRLTIQHGREDRGAGITIVGGGPLLEELIIQNNVVYSEYLGSGGAGMYIWDAEHLIIRNSEIIDNTCFEIEDPVEIYDCLGGGINIMESKVLLDQVVIAGNKIFNEIRAGHGIGARYSDITIKNSIIENNGPELDPDGPFHNYGGGINIYNTHFYSENVIIRGHEVKAGGGMKIKYVQNGEYNVEGKNTIITDNRAKYGAGMSIYCSDKCIFGGGFIIKNNDVDPGFTFPHGGGIYISVTTFDDEQFTLKNCIIDHNNGGHAGGGLSLAGELIILVNLVITNNYAGYGDAIDLSFDPTLILLNTIIRNSLFDPTISYFHDGVFAFDHSNIQNGPGIVNVANPDGTTIIWGEGNIDEDPQFVNFGQDNFNLSSTSPCIDAGTELFVWEGDTILNMPPEEYYGDAPDMGALEYNPENDLSIGYDKSQIPEEHQLVSAYPNPFNPVLNLDIQNTIGSDLNVDVYDIHGVFLETIYKGAALNKYLTLQWNAYSYPSGIYFIKIVSERQITTQKVLLLK